MLNIPRSRYDSDDAWVLCLRAHIDAGPTDRPADWEWSPDTEILPGWESGPEVFIVVEPGAETDTICLRHVAVIFVADPLGYEDEPEGVDPANSEQSARPEALSTMRLRLIGQSRPIFRPILDLFFTE